MSARVDPVDERLPLTKLVPLGLQHVLVMYAGAIAPPLIIGGALKLPKDQLALLINADLFAAGLVTLLQCVGIRNFVGIRLPVMMGVTFAAVSPMIAMATNPSIGLLGIFGAVLVAGVFGVVIAPFISRLLAFFPPVVTGTIITVIGISLMRIGINWAGGGLPSSPDYGDLTNLGLAAFVLVVILAILKFGRGFVVNIAVLLGIIVGFVVAALLGKVNLAGLGEARWVDVIYPLQFGMPTFDLAAAVTMCLVMIVSTGMFLAVAEMTGRSLSRDDLTRGLRADGFGTMIGGFFNTFPYTSFSQNVGLVGITGVRSRWVCATGGIIMVALGLVPKLAVIVASVPQFVLGGAGTVMFGMVAATGIKILSGVDFKDNRYNLYIVAIAVGFGMIPLVADKLFQQMPHGLSPLLHSGILLAAVVAVVLNLLFNGLGDAEEITARTAAVARGVDHV